METALYIVVGLTAVIGYVVWVSVFGTERAVRLCLVLLAFRVVLPPQIGRVVGFESMHLVPDLLIPLTFVVWLARRYLRREAAEEPPIGEVVPKVMLVVVLAFLVSYRGGVNIRDFLSDLQKWLVYGLAFVLVSQHARGPRMLTVMVNALLIGGALATLRDLAGYLDIVTLPEPFGYVRNRDAFLYSGVDLERYQGSGWPFFINTLLLCIYARLVAGKSSVPELQRWVLSAYAGVLVFLLALSLYRGDWLALAGALACSVLVPGMLSPRAIRAVLVTAGLAVLATGVFAGAMLQSGLTARVQTLARPGSEEHVIARVDAMAEGWLMFREHPIRGIGLGQFGVNFERYGHAQLFGAAFDPSFFRQANNDFVQYLATTGLIGFAALGLLFWRFLVDARRLAATAEDEQVRAIGLAAFLTTLAFLATAMSQDPAWDKTYGVLLFSMFGLVWSARGDASPAPGDAGSGTR